jgi:hypothetical protein
MVPQRLILLDFSWVFTLCSPNENCAIPMQDLFAAEPSEPRGPTLSPDASLFRSKLLAGFECGHLGWNDHDLLATTLHLPERRMEQHFRLVGAHGLLSARDGLPWRHDPASRLAAANATGLEVIWDLSHFDPPPDPVGHARRVALAADRSRPLWLCPVNEPSLYPHLSGMPRDAAVDLFGLMARVARDHHPDVRLLANDPITGIGERQFGALDPIVAHNPIDVIGVNYYPHTARTSLLKVLVKTWKRYRKPIMVSETSWHDGHPVHHHRYPGFNKGLWLRHILQQVALAEARGVVVVGVCWYPIIDCPPWNRPRSRGRWSHGLIRQDLSLDPALVAEILAQDGTDRRAVA